MGFREILNKQPKIIGAVAAVAAIAAVGLALSTLSGKAMKTRPQKGYYSTDDGKTWFEDDHGKWAPFQKDGKEAVVARLFRCGSGQPFVGRLEKLTPEAKKKIDELLPKSTDDTKVQDQIGLLAYSGTLIKKPGDAKWYNSLEVTPAVAVKCPNGSTEGLEPVDP